jgi:hypothetical protein
LTRRITPTRGNDDDLFSPFPEECRKRITPIVAKFGFEETRADVTGSSVHSWLEFRSPDLGIYVTLFLAPSDSCHYLIVVFFLLGSTFRPDGNGWDTILGPGWLDSVSLAEKLGDPPQSLFSIPLDLPPP